MDEWIKAYQGQCADAKINYKRHRLRRRHPGVHRRHRRLRRLRLGAQGGGAAAGRRQVRRRPGAQPADGDRPDRGRLQPRRRRQPAARRRRPSPRSSPARSPSGTTRRSPPTTRAPSCRTTTIQTVHRSDESGTTDNFTKYLSKTAEADWTFGNAKAWKAPGGTGAAKSDGVATPGQEHRRRDLLRRALLRREQRPEDGQGRERRRRVRRADRRERRQDHRGRQGRRHRQRPQAEHRLRHHEAGRLPDRPGHLRDRLQQGQRRRPPPSRAS